MPEDRTITSPLMDAVFEQAGVGLCLVGPGGTVLRANGAWLRSMGLSAGQALGAELAGLLPDREAALQDQARARAGQAVRLPPRKIAGREAWWDESIAPVPMDGGTGLLVTVREVTGGPAEQALRRSEADRERAEAAVREGERRLREALDRLRVHVESTPLALVEWDAQYRVIGYSARAQELFGWSAEEVLGKRIDEIPWVPEEDWPSLRVLMRDMSTGARPANVHANRNLRKDGALVFCEWYNSALHDQSGQLASVLSLVLDVTERRRAEAALRQANEALREADRRKDEFLGMLSHELRNPLAPIRTSTYLLRRAAPGSDQAHRAQHVIERQVEHLARLVDDLLDVTRIARGKIELRRTSVELREVVRRAADDFRPQIEDRGISFRAALPDEPVWADVDPTRITQVVGNLLHNAAKFTHQGDEVALSLVVRDGQAILCVRDSGAGIDPALLPSIFDPFVQGERTLARTEGGLGLGLALVRGVTELHGGTVEAASGGRGRGAEFVVRLPLPLPRARASAGPAPPHAPERPRSTSRRVLVVDDNVDAADSLAEVVRMLGHDVEVAYDGPSAVAAARASRPDVVLCDIGLPGMDGHEVARALRAAGLHRTQLVAVSGYAQPEDVKRSADAGFDAHVAKPPDPAHLERLLG